MILAKFWSDGSARLYKFSLQGHAGKSQSFENSIVCAACSAIAETAIGALQDIADIDPVYSLREGDIACHIQYEATTAAADRENQKALTHRQTGKQTKTLSAGEKNLRAEIIMETAYLGLLQIQESYGKDKISLEKLEVQND